MRERLHRRRRRRRHRLRCRLAMSSRSQSQSLKVRRPLLSPPHADSAQDPPQPPCTPTTQPKKASSVRPLHFSRVRLTDGYVQRLLTEGGLQRLSL